MKKIYALLLVVILCLFGQNELRCQKFSPGKDVDPEYKGWAGNPANVGVFIDSSWPDSLKQEIRNAMNKWNAAGCKPQFVEVNNANDAKIVVTKGPADQKAAGDIKIIYETPSKKIHSATIIIAPNTAPLSLEEVATHEFGHSLGLDDTDPDDNPTDVMKGRKESNGSNGNLSVHDKTQLKAAMGLSEKADTPKKKANNWSAILKAINQTLTFPLGIPVPPTSIPEITSFDDDLIEINEVNIIGDELDISVYVDPSHGSGIFYLDIVIYLAPSPDTIEFIGYHYVHSNPVSPEIFQCPFIITESDGIVNVEWENMHSYPNATIPLRSKLMVNDSLEFKTRPTGDYSISLDPGIYTFELHVDDYQVNSASYIMIYEVLGSGTGCEQPDNGSGTATLPPIGCDYTNTGDVFRIMDGLPPGTTIECNGTLKDFVCCGDLCAMCSLPLPPGECEMPGGTLGGTGHCFTANLEFQMVGTGTLAGWERMGSIPVNGEAHSALRIPGTPVQIFSTLFFTLNGQIIGDPDFDLLRITAGDSFGYPSPGQTTLTQLPGGNWQVDSFFDITYRIDFIGAPGGILAGLSGSTTSLVRIQTGGDGSFDWGDAPDAPYPALAVSNGATHMIVPGFCLGNLIDPEPDGQPDPNALGDDNDGNNDDDGVNFTSTITRGQPASFDVIASAPGFLNVWFDFDINGSWADAGEHMFQDAWLNPGLNSFALVVPQTSLPGTSFTRFRFSSMPGLSFSGTAPDGEVEDYEISILDMPILDYDWGDAPDLPYPTKANNNGANHMIVPGFCLGNSVDPEPDGQPDPNALGDDNDGNNDDDGVIFNFPLIPGQPSLVTVIASVPGMLNAWFDYNKNGSWADPGEHVFMDFMINPGPNPLPFVIPITTTSGNCFTRFRFSGMPGLQFFGPAPDGEVEDYMISIGSSIGDIPIDPDPLMTFVQNEISMAIVPSPTGGSPTALLAAYNDHPYSGGPGLGVSYSHDGGITWTPLQLPYPLNPLGIPFADAFDPTATADGSGNLYAAHISTDYDWTNGPESGFYIHKSTDGGMTWNPPVQIAYDGKPIGSPDPNYRLNDRCQIICDVNPLSPYYNHLYAVWIKDRGWNMPLPYGDIYFSGSSDGGLTWSPQIILNGPQSNMANMPIPAVAPNGTLYVVWIDYNVITGGLGTIYIDFSFDGGLTWQTSGTQVGLPINLPPLNLNGNTDVRAKGAAVVDVSPYNPMEVYIVYAEQIVGSPDEGDIFLIKSLDGGITWTNPLRVNDDLTFNDQVLPWMDVKPNGAIDIVWYDRRNDPADLFWDIYMATSLDGGNTFLQNQKVNSVSAPSPQTPSGIWFGEYLGVVVDNTHAYIGFTSSALDIKGDVFFAKKNNPSIEMDFGDAPDPTFKTLLVNDGARHILDGVTFLGAGVDPDPDGQPDPLALGDDNDGNDDEDGITFGQILTGGPAQITVTTSVAGYLQGWMDFNADGDWNDPGEQIFTDEYIHFGYTVCLNYMVPVNAIPGTTYTRFRFSTVQGLSYIGSAPNGEVEDYEVEIAENPDIKWIQEPCDQLPGLHAHDFVTPPYDYIILADDWLCKGGMVTDIHWWGNYELDAANQERRGAGINHFHVSIHADDPTGTCLPLNPEILGFDIPFSTMVEQNTGLINIEGGGIYLYEFILPQPFDQLAGNSYWIDICAYSNDPTNPAIWRWQESDRSTVPILCPSAEMTSTMPWQSIIWTSIQPSRYSDMAFVITSEEIIEEIDFGDANDPLYPTLLANDGARHILDGVTFLGASVDPEADGQPDPNALGDDNDGNDDEDGVTFDWPLEIGNPCKITVNASVSNALFSGWIDFNGNGNWGDAGEQIFADLPLSVGSNPLSFIVPNTTTLVGLTYARFRYSTQPGLSFTGLAPDGEVEDYEVEIIQIEDYKWIQYPDLTLPGLHAHDYNIVGAGVQGIILADDWTCNGGVVTDIHWWGNYELDVNSQEVRGAGINHFHLSIHAQNGAACLPLDPEVWGVNVPFSALTEMNTGMVNIENCPVYLYEYILDIPFNQIEGTNYWLDITAVNLDPNQPAHWRWQESLRSITPILCGAAEKVDPNIQPWTTISWPQNRFTDMAFIITSVEPPAMDFGDANDPSYPTLVLSDGARHILDGITFLGAGVDPEPDGQPDPNALGDDNDGNDDEDGVVISPFTPIWTPGGSVWLDITASANGYLNAWVDYNANGSWGDGSEQIFINQPLSPGINGIIISVPTNAIIGKTMARYRFSSVLGLSYTGLASDGEVEDYEITIEGDVDIYLKVLLEGPFVGPDMTVTLNTLGILPLSQPYNSDPSAVWYYTGGENVPSIPNADITDWVLVEFRDAPSAAQATRATMTGMQAAFVKKDGSVVGLDGMSPLKFNGIFQNNLYVVIWHRNHLGVLSATPLALTGINQYSYDFTTGAGQAYLNGHKNLGGGIYGMYGADGAPNQFIDQADKTTVWVPQAGSRGYKMGDFNLNGHVNNPDKNDIWVPNLGMGTKVP